MKRQLAQRGIAFEALDNGILSCADPRRLQALCDGLTADKIDAFVRKWLLRLPHPFTRRDRQAGYRYELSILQAEFSRTQVLDRSLSGRLLFEDLIRENLDLGRPDRVQLIFDRRVTRQTPERFRTRVLTEGVVPSLHVTYKTNDLKQNLKGLRPAAVGRALRTELTVNDTRDFEIGRGLTNLAALRHNKSWSPRTLAVVLKIPAAADTARLCHPWLRIQRLIRVVLGTRWNADEWPILRGEPQPECCCFASPISVATV